MIDEAAHGHFPFGRPNTARPMRRPSGDVDVLVLGVYPSAFHVRWWPPAENDPRPEKQRTGSLISSLAVDVEPVVFWDGSQPPPQSELERWRAAVGFTDTCGRVELGHNGPSGTGLRDHYLDPLGVDLERVAYTDLVPWYFVKYDKGSQGEAIRDRYDKVAPKLGIEPATLPKRPSTHAMVELARSDERRDSLRAEVLDAHPQVVVTLGQEAIDGLAAVADAQAGVPSRLEPDDDDYGLDARVTINGDDFLVIPLVHPGLLRQSTAGAPWSVGHGRWEERERRSARRWG